MVSLRLRPSSRIVSTTSCLNSDVYRLFATPFGIKNHPTCFQYIILSNKWGAVQEIGYGEIENILKTAGFILFFLKKIAPSPAKFQKAAGKVGIKLGKPP